MRDIMAAPVVGENSQRLRSVHVTKRRLCQDVSVLRVQHRKRWRFCFRFSEKNTIAGLVGGGVSSAPSTWVFWKTSLSQLDCEWILGGQVAMLLG